MNINDIKDQISERVDIIWEQLQESPAFNNLREKFEVLPQRTQKLITFGSLGFIAFLFALIPLSFFSSSSVYVEEFDTNRTLIRDLISSSAQDDFRSPSPLTYDSLARKIDSRINGFQLLETQKTKAKPGNSFNAEYIPKRISQVNASVKFVKLNLTQVVNFGHELLEITEGVKLIGLNMVANPEDDHYYDVEYDLAHFSFSEVPEKEEHSKSKSKKRRKKRR